jgi:anti-anti-sigma factor
LTLERRAAPALVIAVSNDRGTMLCTPTGELAESVRGQLAESIERSVADGDVHHAVIDLADVTFADAFSLREFADVHLWLTDRHIAVSLVNAPWSVRRAINIAERGDGDA